MNLKRLCLLGAIAIWSATICANPGFQIPADAPYVTFAGACPPLPQHYSVPADQLEATLFRWAMDFGKLDFMYDLSEVILLSGDIEVYFVPRRSGQLCRLYLVSRHRQKLTRPRQLCRRCASDDGIPLGPWCWGDDGLEYVESCRLGSTSEVHN